MGRRGAMWGLQGWEPLIILVIILLIFGPTKLPQLARGLGQALYEFKRASQGILEEDKEKLRKVQEGEGIDEKTLRELARKLGVEKPEEKSKDELVKEVVAKAKEKGLI